MAYLNLKVREKSLSFWEPFLLCQVTSESLSLWYCHMESEVSNSSMNHCNAAIITSSYNKALKPLNIYRVSRVISHYLLLLGEMLPLQLDTTLLLKKLLRVAATYGHMCTTNSMRCLSHRPFSMLSANVEQKKKSENRILIRQRLVPRTGVFLT